MISADARRVGFNGVALGRSQVYGTLADAVCIQSPRHRCPSSWCDCGFYCFHTLDDARDLACDAQYQHSVLLSVLASGRFVRYELGLRYARQTVQAVRVGRCACGRAATALADGGPGIVGWRRLHPVCGLCAGPRPVLSLQAFGALAGGLAVSGDEALADSPLAPAGDGGTTHGDLGVGAIGEQLDESALVPLLSAEVALLQARLDQVQSRLEQLTRRPD